MTTPGSGGWPTADDAAGPASAAWRRWVEDDPAGDGPDPDGTPRNGAARNGSPYAGPAGHDGPEPGQNGTYRNGSAGQVNGFPLPPAGRHSGADPYPSSAYLPDPYGPDPRRPGRDGRLPRPAGASRPPGSTPRATPYGPGYDPGGTRSYVPHPPPGGADDPAGPRRDDGFSGGYHDGYQGGGPGAFAGGQGERPRRHRSADDDEAVPGVEQFGRPSGRRAARRRATEGEVTGAYPVPNEEATQIFARPAAPANGPQELHLPPHLRGGTPGPGGPGLAGPGTGGWRSGGPGFAGPEPGGPEFGGSAPAGPGFGGSGFGGSALGGPEFGGPAPAGPGFGGSGFGGSGPGGSGFGGAGRGGERQRPDAPTGRSRPPAPPEALAYPPPVFSPTQPAIAAPYQQQVESGPIEAGPIELPPSVSAAIAASLPGGLTAPPSARPGAPWRGDREDREYPTEYREDYPDYRLTASPGLAPPPARPAPVDFPTGYMAGYPAPTDLPMVDATVAPDLDDPRHGDPRFDDPRRGGGQRLDDPRLDDPRHGDPRFDDPRRGGGQRLDDPRLDDPRFDDAQREGLRGAGGTLAPERTRPAGKPQPSRAEVRRKLRRRRLMEWPALVVFSLLAALALRTFVVQTFFIPSESMHDTLIEGDRVLVNKLAYDFHDFNRGDVIVFARPPNVHIEDDDLIKRVVGLPGERVEGHDRHVYINGRELEEPYVQAACNGVNDFPPVVVPPAYLFMMGDNRCDSTDSRDFGPVDQKLVVGRAFVLIWPFGRIGWL
jgi:signal peptidase I